MAVPAYTKKTMPHIHTKPNQHDLSVTAYIVRLDTPEPKVLLHQHRKLNRLLPVGGHVELMETPWQAMAHEVQEESGYEFEQLQILQPPSRLKQIHGAIHHPSPVGMNTHQIPADHFHTEVEYGFVVNADPVGNTDEGESTDLRWLTSDELDALSAEEIFPNTRDVYRFILDEALDQWERLPTSHYVR